VSTAPVLGVLVCHNGEPWLRPALSALRRLVIRPRHLLAVDTGSEDGTAQLLAEAAQGPDRVLDGVLHLDRDTGFGAAVQAAVAHAEQRWGDPGRWVWLLHDDCAPEPGCLAALLAAAEVSPSAAVLGPLALDWADPRLVVEAGLTTDASGRRQTGIGPDEPDWGRLRWTRATGGLDGTAAGDGEAPRPAGSPAAFEQSAEVLAVPSAGALVRRDVWTELGGYDPALPLLGDDVDFGWRANRAGHLVLSVPTARLRHARAASRGRRVPHALPPYLRPRADTEPRGATRAHGMRTYLVNCSAPAFLLGLPRLVGVTLLRLLAFLVAAPAGGTARARAELAALRHLLGGSARLVAGRRQRRGLPRRHRDVRGLLVGRVARLRNVLNAGVAYLVRRRVRADVALGRLPDEVGRVAAWVPPEAARRSPRPTGPEALPAGALGRGGRRVGVPGLRRPPRTVVVAVPDPDVDDVAGTDVEPGSEPARQPSPVPRGQEPRPQLVLVDVGARRVLRELLLNPPTVLVLALLAVALVVHSGRLGLDLAGGRLLPVAGLAEIWQEYLAGWHPVAGGTSAPAPALLAVLGVSGALLAPLGGPPAAVSLLLLLDLPLAGLTAYAATRRLRVSRTARAVAAACYALLPAAGAAVAQGRLDAVVAHVLVPPVLAGVVAVLYPPIRAERAGSWLTTASASALGLAVLGAFSPLVHLLVLLVALIGFVVVPGRPGLGRRRVVGLFVVVLAPLGLLLPWPVALLQHPEAVLHGTGATVDDPGVSLVQLLTLHPGGPGGAPLVGGVLLVVALVVVGTRLRRAVLAPLAVTALGTAAVVLVRVLWVEPLTGGPARPGWAGSALVFTACGLLWAVLAVLGPTAPRRVGLDRVVAVAAALTVFALATGALLTGGRGPLGTDRRVTLAPAVGDEVHRTGAGVLVVDAGSPRLTAGRLPRFGDDDLVPVVGAVERVRRWNEQLREGTDEVVREALAELAASGVRFLVLTDAALAERVLAAAGEAVIGASTTSDGRPVLRLLLPNSPVSVLSRELAVRARTGGAPPAEPGSRGLLAVPASLPHAGVRVSEGPEGRLLVLAAEGEPGWQATVDGRPVPLTVAWGHLVAVPLPAVAEGAEAEVRVEPPGDLRPPLLLLQAAVALFVLLTAFPTGRR